MNKQKFFTLLYVALIVAVICFLIWIVFWLKSESKDCIKDPLKFAGEKVHQDDWSFDLCTDEKCYTCSEKVNWGIHT